MESVTGKDVQRGSGLTRNIVGRRGNALVNEGRASGLAYGKDRLVSSGLVWSRLGAIIEYFLKRMGSGREID